MERYYFIYIHIFSLNYLYKLFFWNKSWWFQIFKKGSKYEFEELNKNNFWSAYQIVKIQDDQILIPGLIDCHVHAPQFPNIGLGLDRPLLEWLDKYTFPLEKQYSNKQFAQEVYSQVVVSYSISYIQNFLIALKTKSSSSCLYSDLFVKTV